MKRHSKWLLLFAVFALLYRDESVEPGKLYKVKFKVFTTSTAQHAVAKWFDAEGNLIVEGKSPMTAPVDAKAVEWYMTPTQEKQLLDHIKKVSATVVKE